VFRFGSRLSVMAGIVLGFASTPDAAAQLRIVNYNIAQLQGDTNALEDVFAALNADDKPGFAVAPHAYVFQEVLTSNTSALLARLNNAAPPGVTYVMGTYTNSGEDGVAGAQAMYYRLDILTEMTGAHRDLFTGAGRNADRWRLRLNGYNDRLARFHIYSAHLKAGSSSSDESTRLSGADTLRTDADSLLADTHVIFAGDFNLQDNGEAAYLRFFDPGDAQAFDPLGTGSWSSSAQAIKHTQSPLASPNGGLIGGAMDDRFDFQLLSMEFTDGAGLAIMPGTYRAFGNDGNHFDQAINAGNNTYYPADIARSNALADDLHAASDHIPVVVDYRLPAQLDASMPADLGRVIQDGAVTAQMQVANSAPAVIVDGADVLDYNAVASGALSGSCSGSVPPLSPADTCDFAVDTSTVGVINGTVQVTSPNQGADSPAFLTPTGEVVRPAAASFSDTALQTELTIPRTVPPDSGLVPVDVDVFNFGFDASQALLDIDGVSGVAAPFAFVGGLQSGVGAAPATLSFTFDTTGAGNADFNQVVSIEFSDEDLPGAGSGSLTLTLAFHTRILVGDVDGNCAVELDDLTLLLQGFGACIGDAAYDSASDLDGNGCIDLDDLTLLLMQFGAQCP
jgi:hypothetical protein